MSVAKIRGVAIAYEENGQGTPLVFVHGHPFNRSMWREQLRVFSPNYRVITPDLRGYGDSTVVPGKTPLEDFARDIEHLLEELNAADIVLCGLSMGGQIALEFYHLFPKRVRALILADTFAQLDTDEGRQARYDIAERLMNEGMHKYAGEALPKMIAPRTIEEQPEVAAHVLSMMRATSPEGAAAALRGRAERRDYTPLLSEIAVPTLIIVGSDDEFTPVRDAEFMRQRIPNSRMAVINRAGHMPNMERPAEFNRIVEEFLRTLAQRDSQA
ncbi:MAG TPA: alpha/beta fold hydrolase [Blastocatellia bacterium]|jgi:Predicted hydrolases or acyltransferases (alpha/beta hydrolase superfamily)